jgi:hypothetical protein
VRKKRITPNIQFDEGNRRTTAGKEPRTAPVGRAFQRSSMTATGRNTTPITSAEDRRCPNLVARLWRPTIVSTNPTVRVANPVQSIPP